MTPDREAWRLPKAGSLARLTRVTEPLPPPGPGEATVRAEAIGLNFADVFACLGLYSATPEGSFIPGLECAGVVVAVGPGVDGVRPGDRVMAVTRFGGYATRLNVDVRQLHPLPEGWSFAEGAAWPVQALTAWYALCALGEVAPGDAVLVHSAAGGVGLHALEIAGSLGARVVATVGSEAKRSFLARARGVDPEAVVVRDRLVHAHRVAEHHGVIALAVLEEVEDALLLEQAGDEGQVRLGVLHAVGALGVVARERLAVRDPALIQDPRHDLRDRQVLEDAAAHDLAQPPEARHHVELQPLPVLAEALLPALHPPHEAVEVADRPVAEVDGEVGVLAHQGRRIDLHPGLGQEQHLELVQRGELLVGLEAEHAEVLGAVGADLDLELGLLGRGGCGRDHAVEPPRGERRMHH